MYANEMQIGDCGEEGGVPLFLPLWLETRMTNREGNGQ